LRNGKILNSDDYAKKEIRFDKLPLNVISGNIKNDYIIKGYIRKDSILSTNNLKIKKNLLKNSFIKARIEEENMILEVDAHILSDANIGDIVKIKTANGKILRAKIISLKIAKILE
jgi:flagella basal body P-ring formation protein FlgA